jgi:hypothetical protein
MIYFNESFSLYIRSLIEKSCYLFILLFSIFHFLFTEKQNLIIYDSVSNPYNLINKPDDIFIGPFLMNEPSDLNKNKIGTSSSSGNIKETGNIIKSPPKVKGNHLSTEYDVYGKK